MGIWPSAMLKEFSFSKNSSAKEESISTIKKNQYYVIKKHLVKKGSLNKSHYLISDLTKM